MIGDREYIDVSMRSVKELETMRDFLAVPSCIAVIDIETTGLKPKSDEILQVAICDGEGKELLNSYVMPERRKRWPDAQKVNGITWDMVKDSPTLGELSGRIHSILSSKPLVIGYNLRFDFMMLEAGGVSVKTGGYTWDIMNDCSVMMGNWNERRGEYSFVRLQAIAKYYDVQYKPHDAIEDARATAKVFRRMLNDPEYRSKVEQKESWLIEPMGNDEAAKQSGPQNTKEQVRKSYVKIAILIAVILIFMFAFASCRVSCSSSSRSRAYAYTTSE